MRAAASAVALLALLPATAAAEPPLPLEGPVIAAPALPLPPVALPPVATIAASCPGARRRSKRGRRQAAVRCLVNRARSRAGLGAFARHPSLTRAASRHARDMGRRRYFGHQRSGGPTLTRRARRAGWRGGKVGEALAWGCGRSASPLAVVRSWLRSPPHAAILLSGNLGWAGIGSARAPVPCRGATYVLLAGRG